MQHLNGLINQINEQFNSVLATLNISTPAGHPVCIHLHIETDTPEEFYAEVKPLPKAQATYEIKVSNGLSRHLWMAASKELTPEPNCLSWIELCEIQNKRLIELSKKEILVAFAYYISICCVILHEVSHITLGHCDYGSAYLDTLQNQEKQLSSEKINIIRKSFEAEADRQAGQWLLGIFEHSLTKNGVWHYLLFPSKFEAYEFFIYAVIVLFKVIQDLSLRDAPTYPNPNERLYIILGSLSKYFKQNFPDEHDNIYIHAVTSCLKIGRKLNLIDSYELETVKENALNLAFVDNMVQELNLSNYQHKLELIDLKVS